MRIAFALLAATIVFATISAHADDNLVGVIFAPDGGSANNATAAAVDGGSVPFALTPRRTYSVQCDAPAAVRACEAASCAATLSNGTRLHTAWQLYDMDLLPTQSWIAAIAESGNVSCNVMEYRENPKSR